MTIGRSSKTSKTIFKNIFIPMGSLIITKVIKALRAEMISPASVYMIMIKLLIFIDSVPHSPDSFDYLFRVKSFCFFSYMIDMTVYATVVYLA